MKITIINGQNHKGSSYHAAEILTEKLGESGDITEFFLPRDMNHYCLGCYNCVEDDTKCPYYEEKLRITTAIENADLLIFTTPNYCQNMSGALKSLMDFMFTYWMVHRPRAYMFSKRAVVISTAAGAGGRKPTKAVSENLFYWEIPEIHRYGVSVAARNWQSVSDKKKAKIESDMTALAKKLKKPGKPRVGFRTKLIFKIMGGMQKAGWGSSPVEKKYWEENGWFSRNRPWRKNS